MHGVERVSFYEPKFLSDEVVEEGPWNHGDVKKLFFRPLLFPFFFGPSFSNSGMKIDR